MNSSILPGKEDCFDVAIVGAGPAGSVNALLLARKGLNVVMIERSDFGKPRMGESLPPTIQSQLEELGLMREFLDLNPLPSYGTRSYWGQPEVQDRAHLFTAYQNGWYVERLKFDQMLVDSAVKAGAKLSMDAKVFNARPVEDGQGFILQAIVGGQQCQLQTKFLIEASGRNPTLVRQLGAERIVFDRLVGVAGRFRETTGNTRFYTMIESFSHGWLYSAPLADDQFAVMLMTDGDIAASEGLTTPRGWMLALQEAPNIAECVKNKELIWGPQSFSAISQRLIRRASDTRPWLAVGDAALSVDPISGNGVIRALQTAQSASATVCSVLSGDLAAINNYEVQRDNECDQYLSELLSYYGMEERWPGSVFWKRRLFSKDLSEVNEAGAGRVI